MCARTPEPSWAAFTKQRCTCEEAPGTPTTPPRTMLPSVASVISRTHAVAPHQTKLHVVWAVAEGCGPRHPRRRPWPRLVWSEDRKPLQGKLGRFQCKLRNFSLNHEHMDQTRQQKKPAASIINVSASRLKRLSTITSQDNTTDDLDISEKHVPNLPLPISNASRRSCYHRLQTPTKSSSTVWSAMVYLYRSTCQNQHCQMLHIGSHTPLLKWLHEPDTTPAKPFIPFSTKSLSSFS